MLYLEIWMTIQKFEQKYFLNYTKAVKRYLFVLFSLELEVYTVNFVVLIFSWENYKKGTQFQQISLFKNK